MYCHKVLIYIVNISIIFLTLHGSLLRIYVICRGMQTAIMQWAKKNYSENNIKATFNEFCRTGEHHTLESKKYENVPRHS
jgi:hypothetical protein